MTLLPLAATVALTLLGLPAEPRADLSSDYSSDLRAGQDVAGLRERGFYALALEQAEALADPTDRAREVLEVLYHAGDLAGALRVGLAGLEAYPRDRLLLWRSARLATDLAAAPLALDLTGRLAREAELMEADSGVDASTALWWLDMSSRMEEEAASLNRLRDEQGAAKSRSLWAAVVGLAVLAGFAGWGIKCNGPAQQTGRARS